MMKSSKLAMAAFTAAALGIGATAQATPSILYTLVIGQNNGNTTSVPGFWTMYADDTSLVNEDGGISGVKVTLTGGGTLTQVLDLPKITYSDTSATNADVVAAFQLFRGVNPIQGAQDTVSGAAWVTAGFGQTSGNLGPIPAALSGYDTTFGATQAVYAAHLKIAHGTYTAGSDGNFTISPAALDTSGSLLPSGTISGIQVIATLTPTIGINIVNPFAGGNTPEPASLGVLGLGGLMLLARRRKTA